MSTVIGWGGSASVSWASSTRFVTRHPTGLPPTAESRLLGRLHVLLRAHLRDPLSPRGRPRFQRAANISDEFRS